MTHLAMFHLILESGLSLARSICIKCDKYDTMNKIYLQNGHRGDTNV